MKADTIEEEADAGAETGDGETVDRGGCGSGGGCGAANEAEAGAGAGASVAVIDAATTDGSSGRVGVVEEPIPTGAADP